MTKNKTTTKDEQKCEKIHRDKTICFMKNNQHSTEKNKKTIVQGGRRRFRHLSRIALAFLAFDRAEASKSTL